MTQMSYTGFLVLYEKFDLEQMYLEKLSLTGEWEFRKQVRAELRFKIVQLLLQKGCSLGIA
jgi:hypothetical protein